MESILLFLFLLNILIIAHEFGHFITAKKIGIKIYEFAIGFGPKLLEIRKGGIRYTLRWFPFGGFVHLEEEQKDGLFRKKLWQQIMVILGGILFNIVLGYIALGGFLHLSGYKVKSLFDITPYFAVVEKTDSYVLIGRTVTKDHPLARYTLENGKTYAIIRVEDVEINNFKTLLQSVNNAFESGKRKITIALINLDTREITNMTVPLNKDGKIGIEVIEYSNVVWSYPSETVIQKLVSPLMYGVDSVYTAIKLGSQMLKINPTDFVKEGVGGPVALYAVVNNMIENKAQWIEYLNLVGLLSLNLALLNLLPIPPLDGWQLVRVIIMRLLPYKYVNTLVKAITLGGIIVIILLSILITLKDIKIFLLRG